MNKHPKNFVSICLLSLCYTLLIACSTTSPTNIPVSTATPVLAGGGEGFTNNLNIRIDSIKILENNGDFLWRGEVYFALLAVKKNGNSAKLILPGQGTFNVFVGDQIALADFSLSANNISANELIAVYILAFEDDQLTPEAQHVINIVLEATILALEATKYEYPPASIIQFALDNLAGEALDWWQEADVLGEYSLVLAQSNDWMRGEQYLAQSLNGNLEIVFTILHSIDITGQIGADGRVVFTVINQSSYPLEKVFFSPIENRGWGMNWLEERIPPMQSKSFAIVAGTYDLRVESSEGFYWERSDVRIINNQEWTVNNQP